MAEDNGRITNAILAQKLDLFIASQKEIQESQKRINESMMNMASQNKQDVALLGQRMGATETRLKDLSEATDKAIDNLNNKFTWFNGGNTILGAIAAALAVILGSK